MTQSRRARRFFSELPLEGPGSFAQLSPAESAHLRQILRLGPGDSCRVLDSSGREGEAVIESFGPDGRAKVKLLAVSAPQALSGFLVHLCVAIPKGLKFETLIQKAQEIGVQAITPVMTERTVVRLDPKKESPKTARWHKIAQEAAKQSGSRGILEIGTPALLPQVLKDFSGRGIAVVMHPGEDSMPFRLWLERLDDSLSQDLLPVRVFIGPEGGFSRREIQMIKDAAQQSGWSYHQVSLGSSILKVDTAVIAAAALLKLWKNTD